MNISAPLGRALISPRLSDLPDRLFRVFVALIVYADSNGVVSLPCLDLACRLGVSIWEVQSALKSLQDGDYIVIESTLPRVLFDFVQATPETLPSYGIPTTGPSAIKASALARAILDRK